MLIDITLTITPKIAEDSLKLENSSLAGHLGTHFDSMDKDFPLEYTKRQGIIFDVSGVKNRDICIEDIETDKIQKDMFVAFYTGYIENNEYGSKTYFSDHPQLSDELIDSLLDKGVSVIALDFGGVRRGKEHVPKDQLCADRGTFVIENLCNLKTLVDNGGKFIANTYPMKLTGVTGLPCRVIAEI